MEWPVVWLGCVSANSGVKDDSKLGGGGGGEGAGRRTSPCAVSLWNHLLSASCVAGELQQPSFGGGMVDMPVVGLETEGRPCDTCICSVVERSRREVYTGEPGHRGPP